MRIPVRGRRLLTALVAAGALAIPATATAWDTGYWFFQGYLPMWDGTRSVHHHTQQTFDDLNRVSMSWQCFHEMNHLVIRHDGGWESYPKFGNCDETMRFRVSLYARGGCQNPIFQSTVWTNCRTGRDV